MDIMNNRFSEKAHMIVQQLTHGWQLGNVEDLYLSKHFQPTTVTKNKPYHVE